VKGVLWICLAEGFKLVLGGGGYLRLYHGVCNRGSL